MASKAETLTRSLHDEDFYLWTEHQAALLHARRFDELDLDHLIEEVEDMGGAQKSAVLNNAGVIIEHLLKLEHSPARDPRNGWRTTVREHRRRLRRILTPSLRRILQEELVTLYREEREDAAASMRDFGEEAAAAALPASCPYDLEQILGGWMPEGRAPGKDR